MKLVRAIVVFLLIFSSSAYAREEGRDTVRVGIYITSIHDIDFKQKEFTANLWLWLKYKNRDFDFSTTWKSHKQKQSPSRSLPPTARENMFQCK